LRNAREQRHRGVRSAVIAGGVLLAGTLASAVTVAAQASGTGTAGDVHRSLGYTCSFPSSARMRTGVTITAKFPVAGIAGRRIRPDGIRITVRLPAAEVATLRHLGAAAVSTTALLSVEASQRTMTMSRWQVQSATAQELSAAGDLTIVARGRAAPVIATSRGTVTFTAAGLTLTLHLDSAASASPGSGGDSPSTSPSTGIQASASPGSPSPGTMELRVSCSPTGRRGAALDAIPVASAGSKPHRKSPPGRHKLKLPKDCGHIKVHGSGVAVCGYVTGYSDVTKLYGAAPLQPQRPAKPALVNIDFAYRHVFKPGRLIAFSTGELYYQGHRELPPVRATFLAFGFVPVTATLRVTELTPIQIRSVSGITGLPYPITVSATTRVAIGISDVDVNGVPLAIGPRCRPVSTTPLTLIGRGDNTSPPTGYTVPTGGPLSGQLTIPAFTDCGVTENLDPLLTGSISGPGNYVLMTQGKLCGPAFPQGWTCPPPVPRPIH
jgi:hypothetical protein